MEIVLLKSYHFQVPRIVYSCFSVQFHEIPKIGKWYLIPQMTFGRTKVLKVLSWNSKHRAIVLSSLTLSYYPSIGKWSEVRFAQLCLTLRRHGILQVRILEWVAVPFSKGSSQPKDWAQVSRIAGRFFTS